MRPLRVYLDSSDYSVLSNPRRTDEHAAIHKQLAILVADRRITCHYSGTHLSEMAPVESTYSGAAQRRADILVELCGRNALISQDLLFGAELRCALGLSSQAPDAYSSTGDWFPAGFTDIAPVRFELAESVRSAISEMGLSRRDRRKAERMAFKDGKPTAAIKKLESAAVTSAREGSLDEIRERYPMRLEDARVLARHALGDASVEEARHAFGESLRDPRWMMQWFEKHHDTLTPFIEWTRKPGISMLASLAEMALHAAGLHARDTERRSSLADTLLSSSQWTAWQDEILIRIARRLVSNDLNVDASELVVSAIDKHCPGLSVAIRSLHTAWWSVTRRTPRQPKLSDFPDALHAAYAPYVDLFRADSFMAPHIEKFAVSRGTRVVPKLTGLLGAIDGWTAVDANNREQYKGSP